MYGWKEETAKAAPVGATSLATLCVIALAFLIADATRLWMPAIGRNLELIGVSLLVIAYVLFAPAVACSLYSLVFERSKLPALAGLVVTGLMLATIPESRLPLDALLLLPFWFLGVMVVVRICKRLQT